MTPWSSSPWNFSWVNGSLAYPRTSLGETSFLTLLLSWRIIYMSNKTLARLEPAKAAGPPFFDSRVSFLAGPALLHINFLAHPARSTQSRRDNQSMRERFWRGIRQWGQLFSHISTRLRLLGWENDPLSRNKFSPYKRGVRYLF